MIAEDPIFLLWLAFTVAMSWTVPRRLLPLAWSGLCAVYLGYYSPWSLPMLALVTATTGLALITGRGRHGLVLSTVGFCGLLFVVYRSLGATSGVLDTLGVLGFAYYVLRAIHVLLEGYAGRLPAMRWPDLMSYLWFLPTIQVGPIHRFQPFHRDLARRRWDNELFSRGMQRILWGYAKIILLANYLVNDKFASWVGSMDPSSWWYHYLDTLQYGLNLYFKFAGYSDIAIGFSLMIGFRVMENFNFPFLARDISDFWRRWHISLSSWCRDYVYTPVFSITRVPALAAIATMLVLGLWHELSLRYLLWGAWHGLGIAVCQQWKRSRAASTLNAGVSGKFWAPVALFVTLNFVILSFVITGADSIPEMLDRWQVLLFLTP
jgi:alginate O-acetyltransferase complex protein AlgI